jgi:hypothetical protein
MAGFRATKSCSKTWMQINLMLHQVLDPGEPELAVRTGTWSTRSCSKGWSQVNRPCSKSWTQVKPVLQQ